MNKKIFKKYVIAAVVILGVVLLIYKYTRPYPGSAESDMPVEALNTIVMNDLKFSPPELAVSIGTQVVWLQKDSVPHEIIFESQEISSSGVIKKIDKKFKVIFDEPGEYDYHCGIHPEMKGRIIVY